VFAPLLVECEQYNLGKFREDTPLDVTFPGAVVNISPNLIVSIELILFLFIVNIMDSYLLGRALFTLIAIKCNYNKVFSLLRF
jgi:hypothetical protein